MFCKESQSFLDEDEMWSPPHPPHHPHWQQHHPVIYRHSPLSIFMPGFKTNLAFFLWIAIEVQQRLSHVIVQKVCVSSFPVQFSDRPQTMSHLSPLINLMSPCILNAHNDLNLILLLWELLKQGQLHSAFAFRLHCFCKTEFNLASSAT